MNKNKEKVNVYDWPVRFFHWVFALLFVGAFFIAKVFEDDSAQYPYHMILGLTLCFAVLLRILWGIIGTKYARFTSFELKPSDLINYIKDLFKKSSIKYLGHNPASSWAGILMMVCALGLAISGFFMTHGHKEEFEDIHEVFANGFLFLAIAHVAGIIFHTIKHKDPIGLSMITGKKISSENKEDIKSNYLAIGIVFLLLVSSMGTHIYKNYDSNSRTLKLFGSTYHLGKIKDED